MVHQKLSDPVNKKINCEDKIKREESGAHSYLRGQELNKSHIKAY